MKSLNTDIINPAYVQIGKREAADILGFSITELDRRRKSDSRCPKGFKRDNSRMAEVKFRLSDIYTYSQQIMEDSVPADSEATQ